MSGHVLDRLSAYLDGELGAAEQERFRSHLASCAECAARLEELAAVDGVLRDLSEDAPAGYFEALPSRVRARVAAASAPARGRSRIPVWTLAAAAALVIGVLAPLTLQRSYLREPPDPASRAAAPAPPAPIAEAQASPAVAPGDAAALRNEPPRDLRAPSQAAGLGSARRSVDPHSTTDERSAKEQLAEAPLVLETREADALGGATPMSGRPASTPRPTAAAAPRPLEAPARSAAAERGHAAAGFADAPGRGAQPTPAPGATPESSGRARQLSKPAPPAGLESAEAAEQSAAEARGAKETPQARAAPRDLADDAMVPKAVGATAEPGARASPSLEYQRLLGRVPRDATEARALREQWRRLAEGLASGPDVDEARVRVLEMGAAAWRFERVAEDRALLERDIAGYLAREDARQAPRARTLRETLER